VAVLQPPGMRGRAGNYHCTLGAYLNTLIQAGFAIEEISEPEATPLLADQQPVYTSVPIFLGVRAVASTPAMLHEPIAI